MNDKEKKSIKYFYNLRATIDESYMLFDEGINVKCEKEMIERISTVINLIEKQKAEIEKKDKQLEEKTNRIRNLEKECQKHFDAMMDTIQENSKKDKIIDLMANHIATSDSNLCQYLDMTTKCKYYAGENGKLCNECIKQYFEKKAEEDK